MNILSCRHSAKCGFSRFTLCQIITNLLWQKSIYWHLSFMVWFILCSFGFACCIQIYIYLPSIAFGKAQQLQTFSVFRIGIDYCCLCFAHHVLVMMWWIWIWILLSTSSASERTINWSLASRSAVDLFLKSVIVIWKGNWSNCELITLREQRTSIKQKWSLFNISIA